MEQRAILVADKDTEYLQQLTEFFTGAGYRVETTASTVHLLCNVLEKQTPVLLLGSDFQNTVDLPHLLQLLEKCHRHLAIIMISDGAALPLVGRTGPKGTVYHALRSVPMHGEHPVLRNNASSNNRR